VVRQQTAFDSSATGRDLPVMLDNPITYSTEPASIAYTVTVEGEPDTEDD
jgi:hypothetical protein